MTTIETITAKIVGLREQRQQALIREDYDEASRLDALISEADMDLSQAEEEATPVHALASAHTYNGHHQRVDAHLLSNLEVLIEVNSRLAGSGKWDGAISDCYATPGADADETSDLLDELSGLLLEELAR